MGFGDSARVIAVDEPDFCRPVRTAVGVLLIFQERPPSSGIAGHGLLDELKDDRLRRGEPRRLAAHADGNSTGQEPIRDLKRAFLAGRPPPTPSPRSVCAALDRRFVGARFHGSYVPPCSRRRSARISSKVL